MFQGKNLLFAVVLALGCMYATNPFISPQESVQSILKLIPEENLSKLVLQPSIIQPF